MVQFEGGGRLMADFTDCEVAELSVGQPVILLYWMDRSDRNIVVQRPRHADNGSGQHARQCQRQHMVGDHLHF